MKKLYLLFFLPFLIGCPPEPEPEPADIGDYFWTRSAVDNSWYKIAKRAPLAVGEHCIVYADPNVSVTPA